MQHGEEGVREQVQATQWGVILCGGLTLVCGLAVSAGWMLRLPQVIEPRPGWGGMVLTTALGMVLSGTGLLAALLPDEKLAARWQISVGTILVLLAAVFAFATFTDSNLGISLPALHAESIPDFPYTGRMAPNTALCFILFGLALGIRGHGRKAGIVRTLAISILLIGGLGFAGYCVGMKFLYSWYTSSGLVGMALPTSVNMMLLALGLWSISRSAAGDDVEEAEASVLRTILGDSTALLLVTAIAVAILAVGFMQTTVFRYTADHLSEVAHNDRDLIELALDHRSERAAVASSGAWLPGAIRSWDPIGGGGNGKRPGATAEASMRAFAQVLLRHGFSGVRYRGASGRTLQVGTWIESSAIHAPLRYAVSGELIWNRGYSLETHVPIRDARGAPGEILAQQPMPMLDRLATEANQSSETGALILCTRPADGNLASCFPMRTQPSPFGMDVVTRALPPGAASRSSQRGDAKAREPLPMALALAGESGTILTRDFRGRPVTAAYLPIRNSELGLVLKIDTAETYAPIRRSLTIALPLAVLIVLISLRLMQRRLTPLVDGLVSSREQIRQLALHDPLTGLPNRSLMDDRLRMALGWARRNRHSVAVAVLDLDEFKLVNDTLGHEAGDRLLEQVARRLESCMRSSDTVARMGGDEFMMIFNEIHSIDAVTVMGEKILTAFSSPVELAGQPYRIQLSIGFAVSPPGGGDELTLVRNADTAMYSAKKSGGFRYAVFEEPASQEPPTSPPAPELGAAAAVSGVRQAHPA
jgi:diguanylate cyclase (GGDEF)-like protein